MDVLNINSNHSLYAIYLDLATKTSIQIGRLGMFEFPSGHYIYIGSAKRGIHARVSRHLKIEKKLRWHFDYLRPYGEVSHFETYDSSYEECSLCQHLKTKYGAEIIVKGFGSSDCKCPSHLLFYP